MFAGAQRLAHDELDGLQRPRLAGPLLRADDQHVRRRLRGLERPGVQHEQRERGELVLGREAHEPAEQPLDAEQQHAVGHAGRPWSPARRRLAQLVLGERVELARRVWPAARKSSTPILPSSSGR